ncbi:MAG: hypothetical protein FJ118_05915 [Deltaproteobacteria bacterium]|nr:hypothetical protein [Deltaproteobacteria bacterium]
MAKLLLVNYSLQNVLLSNIRLRSLITNQDRGVTAVFLPGPDEFTAVECGILRIFQVAPPTYRLERFYHSGSLGKTK